MPIYSLRSEFSDTVRLSLPIVIAQLGVVLMGVTDNLFVGRLLGAVPLGAAGLANNLSFLVSSIGLGGLSVVSAMVSRANGQGNKAEINRLFRASLRVALLFSVLFGGASAVVALFFEVFRQTAEVTQMGREFMLILSLSTLPLMFFTASRQLADGLRQPRVAMTITLLALAINALFNYLLIIGVGPFPQMGLNGSATATLLSRVFMAVAMLTYVYRSGLFRPFLQATYAKLPTNEQVRDILRLGLPGGLTFFFEIAAFSIAAIMIGWLGATALGAHQIAINMASTTYMVATGISTAGAIRVGNAVGSGDVLGIRRAGIAAFLLATGFMAVCALVFFTANDWLVSLYIRDNPTVANLAASLVIVGAFFQLSDGVQVVGIGTLRGLSDVNVPTWITLFAYWGMSLPLGYWLAFPLNMGAVGVWLGLLIGLTIAAILLTYRFFKLANRYRATASGRAAAPASV
ncbi:MAG: MATE family efflux transporter [Cytophagales bacterium]|nr:MAG: MATE family efflux transporter [Cytophagales bacterium]